MVSKPITVTVPAEMSEYIESNNLSASKIIQQAINQIMDPKLLEEENPLYKKRGEEINDLKGQLLTTFLRIDELQKTVIDQKDDIIEVQRLWLISKGADVPETRQVERSYEQPDKGL